MVVDTTLDHDLVHHIVLRRMQDHNIVHKEKDHDLHIAQNVHVQDRRIEQTEQEIEDTTASMV